MIRVIYILLTLFSFSFAVVTVGTNGNYHFTTIQEAIDSVTFNPIDAGDLNADGNVDIMDVVTLVNVILNGA